MIIPVPEEILAAEDLGRVHFVGIGGAALSGLARIMVQRGLTVTGSDAKDGPGLEMLRVIGVVCFVGHQASQVEGADTVVVSTAVPADNPEVVRAQELGLRLWPRSAAVQSVMLDRTSVVVTGTHGKTTTTSMLATALLACDADPSYAIGSTLNASGLNAANGSGGVFVAEGDESDGAILTYTPHGAVITNVDADHLDHFGTVEAYTQVFDGFIERIVPGGFLVVCVDDPGARALVERVSRDDLTVVRVGQSGEADLRARGLAFAGETSAYEVVDRQGRLGQVTLQVPGSNYVVDSLAALAAGLELGFGFEELAVGLAGFRGSGRRMELKGQADGVTVYDSYAHHPTEISGDLEAGRSIARGGRLVVCFQPHLFSRTRLFGMQMGHALGAADEVVVMDVYPAREKPEPGIDGQLVADAVPLPIEQVSYEPNWRLVPERIVERTRPGDLVLTLGAGDVTEIGPLVLAQLADRESRS
jgi:UDP-N-acetylmuramate--alanine ligase